MSQTCLDIIPDCDQHTTNIDEKCYHISYTKNAKCDDYIKSSSDLAGEKSNIMECIQEYSKTSI